MDRFVVHDHINLPELCAAAYLYEDNGMSDRKEIEEMKVALLRTQAEVLRLREAVENLQRKAWGYSQNIRVDNR